MTINKVQINENGNKFCGPSVISAICGISTDHAADVINLIRGKVPIRTKVTGVYMHELKNAFRYLRYNCEDIKYDGRLFSFLTSSMAEGIYVIMIPGHFIAIEVNGNHKYICDNHTKEPINAAVSARAMQKVIAVIKVTKRA